MRTALSIFILILLTVLAVGSSAGNNQKEELYASEKHGNLSVATFAGGCFWCVESDFEKLPGVHKVISGFSGGHVTNPSYEEVEMGKTGHVESVQVYYDPQGNQL